MKKGILKQLLHRVLQLLLVVWSVGTLTFVLTRSLPGNMAYRIAAGRYGYDQTDSAAAAQVAHEIGLDLPWWQSYGQWLLDLVQFKLGNSLVSGDPVWQEIAHEFGHTLSLALVAIAFSFLIGPPLGMIAALRFGGVWDKSSLLLATLLRALPTFIIGILLITLLSVTWHLFPAAGYGSFKHFVLPALTLALGLSAVSLRVSRQAMHQVLISDYYQFARLKGLSPWQCFSRHALRNAAIPIIAYHAVQLIYLVEGVVVVEALFAWPGSGHALVHAIIARDVPMIQGTALTMGALFVVLNALVDILNGVLDPRIKLTGGA